VIADDTTDTLIKEEKETGLNKVNLDHTKDPEVLEVVFTKKGKT
jgi:hypothetical protein